MFRQKRTQFVNEREDRLMAAIHDGVAADLDDLHPRKQPDRTSSSDSAGKVAIEQGLTRERRSDMLDVVGGPGHGIGPLARGDDGADMLACERSGQVSGDEAVHNLHKRPPTSFHAADETAAPLLWQTAKKGIGRFL